MSGFFQFPHQFQGQVHHQQDHGNQHGEADAVVAAELLEGIQGVARLGKHEEHKIGVQQQIHRQRHHRQNRQQADAAGNEPPAQLQIAAENEEGNAEIRL